MSVYSAAYTIKEYIGELKTATPTQNKKQETPKTKPKTVWKYKAGNIRVQI